MPQLKSFKKRHPNVHIRIHTLAPNDMLEALKSREIDAAISWPNDFSADDEFSVYDLCSMNLTLAVNSLHPFASMDRIPVELMNNETCYMLSFSNQQLTKKNVHNDLVRAGLSNLNVCECSYTEEIFMQLELNNSIALVPDFFSNFTNNQIVYREMDINQKIGATLSFINFKNNKNPSLDLLRRSMRK